MTIPNDAELKGQITEANANLSHLATEIKNTAAALNEQKDKISNAAEAVEKLTTAVSDAAELKPFVEVIGKQQELIASAGTAMVEAARQISQNAAPPAAELLPTKLTLVAEHHQNVSERTKSVWANRNKTFLILLGAVGVELLLIFRPQEVIEIFVNIYKKYVHPDVTLTDFTKSFPLSLFISLLLVVILYLMIQIFQRTKGINNTYKYLDGIEDYIRERLNKDETTVKDPQPFSQESTHYKENKGILLSITGIFYAVVLGMILGFLVWGRLFYCPTCESLKEPCPQYCEANKAAAATPPDDKAPTPTPAPCRELGKPAEACRAPIVVTFQGAPTSNLKDILAVIDYIIILIIFVYYIGYLIITINESDIREQVVRDYDKIKPFLDRNVGLKIVGFIAVVLIVQFVFYGLSLVSANPIWHFILFALSGLILILVWNTPRRQRENKKKELDEKAKRQEEAQKNKPAAEQ